MKVIIANFCWLLLSGLILSEGHAREKWLHVDSFLV